ncbi:MAG TPA: Uma2 family endonuclease [Bryobacteraceae bacterium]|jgi:Uma2 family endonuclease
MSTILIDPAYHLERIDGREVQKPLPKKLHAFVQSYLIRILSGKAQPNVRVLPELNVLCGDDRVIPDVTVVRRNARYIDGDLADPAILAVEILSPDQPLSILIDKAERLIKAGTPMCWIIWPERRQAWMFSVDALREAGETLTAGNAIEISVAAMWADLDES